MGLFKTGKMAERRRRLRDTIQNWLRDSAQSSTWVQPIEAHGMGQREDLLKDTLGLLGETLCWPSRRTGKRATPAGRRVRQESDEDDLSRSSDTGSQSEITASSSWSGGPSSARPGDGSWQSRSGHGRRQARERLAKPVRGRGRAPIPVHGRPASHARVHDSSSCVGRGDDGSGVSSKRDADAATAAKSPHPSASWQGFRPPLGRQAAAPPPPPLISQFGYMLYAQVPIYRPSSSNRFQAQPTVYPSHVAGNVPSQAAPPSVQFIPLAAHTPIQDSKADNGSAEIERGDNGDTPSASSNGQEDAAPASPRIVDRLQAVKAEFGASMKLARTLRPTPALDRLLDDQEAQYDILAGLIQEHYEGAEQVARFRRLNKQFVDQLVELVLEQPRMATAPPREATASSDCPERGGAGQETKPVLHVCSDCGVTRSRRFHRSHPARHAVGRNFCGVCARTRSDADCWAGEHFCSQCGCVRSGAFHALNPAPSNGGLLENRCSACRAAQRSKTPSPDSDAGDEAVGSEPCRRTPIEVCDLGLMVTDAFRRLQTADASSTAVGQTLSSPDVREDNTSRPPWSCNGLVGDSEAHIDQYSEFGGRRESIRPQAAKPTWGSSAALPQYLSDPAAPWPYASPRLRPQPSDHDPDQDARDGCRPRPCSSASSFSSSSGRSVRFQQTARVRMNADALYYRPAVPDHDVPIRPEDHTTPRNIGIYGRYPLLSPGGRPYPLYGQERFHHYVSPLSAPSQAWYPHRTPAHYGGDAHGGASDEHTAGVFDHHPPHLPEDDSYVRRHAPISPDDFCGVFSHPINFSDEQAGWPVAASTTRCDDEQTESWHDCNPPTAPWSSWSSAEVTMPVPGFVEELADTEQGGGEPSA